MEGRNRIVINDMKHTLHRFANSNPKSSSDEEDRLKSIMYKIIEEPF